MHQWCVRNRAAASTGETPGLRAEWRLNYLRPLAQSETRTFRLDSCGEGNSLPCPVACEKYRQERPQRLRIYCSAGTAGLGAPPSHQADDPDPLDETKTKPQKIFHKRRRAALEKQSRDASRQPWSAWTHARRLNQRNNLTAQPAGRFAVVKFKSFNS